MKRRELLIACAALTLQMPLSALAQSPQSYPSRPVKLVVPFPAGGGNDVLARVVAEKMSRSLGQPIIIDNRPGAAGVVGTRYVAKIAPDGYTLLLGFTGTMAVNPVLYPNAGFDPSTDFTPIGRIGSLPMILVVSSTSKLRTLSDVIDKAKQNPGKLTYGSGGAGTLLHIAAEMVASRAGVELTHVPYKSTGTAATDMMGGEIDMLFSAPLVVMGNIKGGRLRAIAVTSTSRIEALPNVPTMAEAGLTGFSAIASYGLLAPAKTPQPIIQILNKALNDALAMDDVRKQLASDVTTPRPGVPSDYTDDMKVESEGWGSTVKRLGLRAD